MKPGLPVWRSLLYVPVNVEKFVEKAHSEGPIAYSSTLRIVCLRPKRSARESWCRRLLRGCGAAGQMWWYASIDLCRWRYAT